MRNERYKWLVAPPVKHSYDSECEVDHSRQWFKLLNQDYMLETKNLSKKAREEQRSLREH